MQSFQCCLQHCVSSDYSAEYKLLEKGEYILLLSLASLPALSTWLITGLGSLSTHPVTYI